MGCIHQGRGGVSVEPHWVEKFDSVVELFAEAGLGVTANGGFPKNFPKDKGDPCLGGSPQMVRTLCPKIERLPVDLPLSPRMVFGSVWSKIGFPKKKGTAGFPQMKKFAMLKQFYNNLNSMNYTDFWGCCIG
ncbi:MAG: hypothetical protein CM15mP71_4560 [Candidatus Poseidoniales archaeon]|nr:MAG: hypothetical protein CM15mP71_4560 [Candidatus Poseidoniales archaeon]